jgi:hypothetical protein
VMGWQGHDGHRVVGVWQRRRKSDMRAIRAGINACNGDNSATAQA